MKRKLIGLLLFACLVPAVDAVQTKPIHVNRALVEKLTKISPDSSNAHQVEVMLGEPSACMPTGVPPSESWMCQWKGDLSSHAIRNTLNIIFEGGSIAAITAVDEKGTYYNGQLGAPVKINR